MSENLGMLISSWLTAALTALILVLAWWQLTCLRKEADRARRPYVFVELVRGTTSKQQAALYLSFTNTGKTPARNVTATFAEASWKAIGGRHLPFESDPGLLLLPNTAVTYFIGQESSPLTDLFSTPQGVTISLRYRGDEKSPIYEEILPLSLLTSYGARRRSTLAT